MAVLEPESRITSAILKKYLPVDFDVMLPARLDHSKQDSSSGSSGYSERDIFYKVLFDLKSDMTDLKKIVLELLKTNKSSEEIIESNQALMQRVWSEDDEENDQKELIIHPVVRKEQERSKDDEEEDLHEPYVIESDHSVGMDENLSLEAKEEEFIRKALLKNNGKRKKAAQDLGISERTLYRKIKEYGIEY